MPENISPHTTLTVKAGARPLRVAYLLDPDTLDGDRIDAITKRFLDRWGGRYRGLFPLSEGDIPPSCWPILKSLDPDVVVALQPLDDAMVQRITRQILPYGIFSGTLEPPRSEGGPWHFQDPTNGVDLFGVPHMLALNAGAGPSPRLLNLQEDDRNAHRSFILRNFGFYPRIVAAQAALERVPHDDLPVAELSATELLRLLAKLPYHVTPLELAATGCPSPGLPFERDHRLGQLHVIVGSTARDAMLAWNRALYVGGLHRHKTFWIPASSLADDDACSAFVYWVNHTGWRHDEGARLVSYEHALAALELLADRLREKLRRAIECTALDPNDYLYPSLKQTTRRSVHFAGIPGRAPTITEHVNFADGVGSMAIPSPPLQDSMFNQGEWMIDVVIPHRPEQYSYTNRRPAWTLPKRPSFGPSFFPGNHQARITASGLPSACVSSTAGRLELRVPTDRELFFLCLAPQQVIDSRDGSPQPVFSDLATSDAGRRLRGMLQVFGRSYDAARVFEDPFWRDTLLFMAGERHAANDDRAQRLEETLQGFLSAHGTIGANGPEIPVLADALAKAVTGTERRRSRLTPAELKQRFVRSRQVGLADESQRGYWDARATFDDFHHRCLSILLNKGVLFLGVEVTCPQCGVLQWFKVEALAASVTCPGCGTSFPLPAEPSWCYQLNDLVGNALRTSGCLAVLQALIHVGEYRFTNEPFIFLAPQDLFKTYDGPAHTEVDLMCIADGAFIIGEVKSRASGFRCLDVDRMGDVARALLPDKVLFAAPSGVWRDDALERLTALVTSLAELDVKVERLEMTW